ncbi:2-keto-4-pentenoate hydratase [Terribacillus aidingensis]|uniref:2-keto-4-pentenoate hydratase n=1 Tax=Terribacillus aidingensis TaxID=586416 RepID=A0A285P3F2_9BACI|nr:2-keto-4-pentenoate hydratase [Terribacillus aidingensis]SNZ15683.1 2-keto-4-pentenoate hydratase [Terribacillus aidingensis]
MAEQVKQVTKEQLAAQLLQVYETKQPIDFFSNVHNLSVEESYEVQQVFAAKRSKQTGKEIKGYKISMTSPRTQALFSASEPAFGTLFDDTLHRGHTELELASMFSPLLEPEIVFVLKEDLSIGAAEQEILEKCVLHAGLEIPDSRFADWFPKFQLSDLICDNGVTGKVVLAASGRDDLTQEEAAQIKLTLTQDGKHLDTGYATEVMGNPVASVAWLTQKLGEKNQYLKKGMAISSGTFLSPIPLAAGSYSADFSHIGQIKLEVN